MEILIELAVGHTVLMALNYFKHQLTFEEEFELIGNGHCEEKRMFYFTVRGTVFLRTPRAIGASQTSITT